MGWDGMDGAVCSKQSSDAPKTHMINLLAEGAPKVQTSDGQLALARKSMCLAGAPGQGFQAPDDRGDLIIPLTTAKHCLNFLE
jgi:hypothetical protein